MLGDERKGLSEGQLATCDALVKIPMVGSPDSLNIAMAASVMLYEVHNQRHPVKRKA
jgi:tRNA G18 (ribose-2'-O)-methylase SpoU